MRRFMSLAVAAFLMAFGSPAFAQTPPNVLVVGQIAEPKSLDPSVDTAVNDFRILMNMYDGLVRYKDGTLQPEPALAKSWEISKDGLTYTFHLRSGVKFHDGTPFNAEAVKFTFDRMLDKNNPYHDTGPFPLAFFFSSIDTVTAVDDMTVVFKLKEPYAPFLSNLAYPAGLIVSPAAVKKWGKDFGRHPSGTGAFKFEQWDSNSKVVVTRNDDYWDGEPPLEAIVYPADHRRQYARGRDAVGRPRRDGRGAAGQPGPVQEQQELQGLRAGRTARLVPDPQHQGRPVQEQAHPPGGQLRHQQEGDRRRHPAGHRAGRGRPDAAGLRLGL